MFEGRKLLIATKHHKEKVIAPILEKELGVQCILPSDFDTDQLGTFTGEIEREEDALLTVKKKCMLAMSKENVNMALASEGSFGPHPTIPFAHADDEIIYFVDRSQDLEIFVRVLTPETNFNAMPISSLAKLKEFARKAGFPDHALILKKSKEDLTGMVKGIQDGKILMDTYEGLMNEFGNAYVETDMRAMYNPTRMKVIEQATHKLIQKINSTCDACQTPGFGITAVKEGLPCSLCGRPTASILSYVYECQKCSHTKEVQFPNQKEHEDPMYCDFCNP